MRIIGGEFGGRKLTAVPGIKTRPTSARVREAIFSTLLPVIKQSLVLDLFAGTGALGLEALSRGAAKVEFVDFNSAALEIVRRNIQNLGVVEKTKVHKNDSLSFLQNCQEQSYDLIFLDPPYLYSYYEDLLKTIATKGILRKNGIIVVETSSKYELIGVYFNLVLAKTRNYGDTKIWYFEHKGE
ncbi:MAG: 16S rRNA (guanine(966)-N(2))-methyltransferase RsmD [Clostridia bacterium]